MYAQYVYGQAYKQSSRTQLLNRECGSYPFDECLVHGMGGLSDRLSGQGHITFSDNCRPGS